LRISAGLSLVVLLAPALAWAGPSFDSKDPVDWAVHKLQESPDGPKLRLWEPKGPRLKPPRNADGTLRDPDAAFPDSKESNAVLREARAMLALGPQATPAARAAAFSKVAAAAESWARYWTGDETGPLNKREAKALVKAVQSRMISNPAVPRFNELIDPKMAPGVDAEVDFTRGWDSRKDKQQWRFGRGEAALSVTYAEYERSSLAFEVTRLHEYVHVVDSARLGEVDGEGRRVRDLPEAELGLFTEAKAYAIDYLIQRRCALWEDSSFATLADALGKRPQDVSFEEYLSAQLSGGGLYPWADGLRKSGLRERLKEKLETAFFNLREALRILRGNEVRYLRTIAP
jgi:hypothetical protein